MLGFRASAFVGEYNSVGVGGWVRLWFDFFLSLQANRFGLSFGRSARTSRSWHLGKRWLPTYHMYLVYDIAGRTRKNVQTYCCIVNEHLCFFSLIADAQIVGSSVLSSSFVADAVVFFDVAAATAADAVVVPVSFLLLSMFDHGGDIAVVSASADTGGRYLDRGAISETAAAAAAGAAAGAATAAAERAQSSPCYRPQRVPGARALGPFLQAMTASRQMKVSHEVCRVMTASVKVKLVLLHALDISDPVS